MNTVQNYLEAVAKLRERFNKLREPIAGKPFTVKTRNRWADLGRRQEAEEAKLRERFGVAIVPPQGAPSTPAELADFIRKAKAQLVMTQYLVSADDTDRIAGELALEALGYATRIYAADSSLPCLPDFDGEGIDRLQVLARWCVTAKFAMDTVTPSARTDSPSPPSPAAPRP